MAHAAGDAFRWSVPPSVSDRTKIGNARVARTALWVIAVAWVFASGCAQKDWIDRTLVTTDVSGVWTGSMATLDGQPMISIDVRLDCGRRLQK
jgi:hypothetical protein